MPSSWFLFSKLILLSIVIAACAPRTIVTPVTPALTPPANMTQAPLTCAGLEAAWSANDWPWVLNVLQHLQSTQQRCETGSLEAKTYAAHFNYAASLESQGQRDKAIEQYRAALLIDNRGREALNALVRLNALPTLPPPPCQPSELASYPATSGDFVRVTESGFALNGQPFHLRGLNYYPRRAPWEAFLTKADLNEMAQELDLIARAGFNTLRITVWYDPLFTCEPERAVPQADGFTKLDAVIGLARERNLRLIVTLNDLPDLYFRPLYTDYARYDAQTAFIIKRYRDDPTIMAWDLRNEPDLDYSADGRAALASSEDVLKWLTHAATVVWENDQQHLVTIGWWGDPTVADQAVDFLSFHHWTEAAAITQRIEAIHSKSTKPIVLEEVGYPAWDQTSEARQAQTLQQVIAQAEEQGVAGWLIWTAFDFQPPAEQSANPEYYFGLWHRDATPKPALKILPLHVGP